MATQALNWDNAFFEPKRPYRFVVPFPVYVPRTGLNGKISEIFPSGMSTELVGPKSKYGADCYFDTLAISVTKPQITTTAYRIPDPAGGFKPIRKGQVTYYDFEPVTVELIDTYSHDIEASLTAMLYSMGKVQAAGTNRTGTVKAITAQPGLLTPLSNNEDGSSFHIIELLDAGRYTLGEAMHGSPGDPAAAGTQSARGPAGARYLQYRARKIILNNAHLTGVTLGTLSHNETGFSTVKVQIVYDSMDYEYISHRALEQGLADQMLAREQYVLAKRKQTLIAGRLVPSPAEIAAQNEARNRAWDEAQGEFERTNAVQNMSAEDRTAAQQLAASGMDPAEIAAMTPEERSQAANPVFNEPPLRTGERGIGRFGDRLGPSEEGLARSAGAASVLAGLDRLEGRERLAPANARPAPERRLTDEEVNEEMDRRADANRTRVRSGEDE